MHYVQAAVENQELEVFSVLPLQGPIVDIHKYKVSQIVNSFHHHPHLERSCFAFSATLDAEESDYHYDQDSHATFVGLFLLQPVDGCLVPRCITRVVRRGQYWLLQFWGRIEVARLLWLLLVHAWLL